MDQYRSATNQRHERVELINSQVEIRKNAKDARAMLTSRERSIASRKICERVALTEAFQRAQLIACYIPMKTEVDTWPLIERAHAQKKRIFAPVTQENFSMVFREYSPEDALIENKMGLQEPVAGLEIDPRDLDLVITPLVAFDDMRHRIGMGGGYYDRAFEFLIHDESITKPLLAGVSLECQRVEKIAPNPWDIPLFRIITESFVY